MHTVENSGNRIVYMTEYAKQLRSFQNKINEINGNIILPNKNTKYSLNFYDIRDKLEYLNAEFNKSDNTHREKHIQKLKNLLNDWNKFKDAFKDRIDTDFNIHHVVLKNVYQFREDDKERYFGMNGEWTETRGMFDLWPSRFFKINISLVCPDIYNVKINGNVKHLLSENIDFYLDIRSRYIMQIESKTRKNIDKNTVETYNKNRWVGRLYEVGDTNNYYSTIELLEFCWE
tara:strand:- start:1124 stop:1816 length:693 start_codon:yes stop_codon:yes gene_type:complete